MRKCSSSVAAFLLALLACLGAGRAEAHGRSVSYSSWELDESGARVSLRMKLLELSRIGPEALPPGTVAGARDPGGPDLAARIFPSELVLVADGRVCPPDAPARRRPDQKGWVRYEWRVDCSDGTNRDAGAPLRTPANASRLSIHSSLLLRVAPSHMHFARVRLNDDSDSPREKVLTEASPEFVIRSAKSDPAAPSEVGSRFQDYLVLGMEHILSGWDHLAFVFGLLLLAPRFGEVARLITGFTLAHSLTLALAVLDFVHPRVAAVEAVIAFSVALVAIEKGWLMAGRNRAIPAAVLFGLLGLLVGTVAGIVSLPVLTILGLLVFTTCYFALVSREDAGWLRILLTFAFGLVHGFGFAGILLEMNLPANRLVPALLGFNLGVEAGQIGVLLVLSPLLFMARHFASERLIRLGAELGAASLCGLGLFWFIQRAF